MKNCLFIIYCYLGFLGDIFLIQGVLVTSRHRYNQKYRMCPPISLKNGMAKMRNFRARLVRFTCKTGYSLAGQRFSNCLSNGTWDSPPPKCVRPACKHVPQQDNILIYPTHAGAVLYFHCKSGYAINGPEDIFCDGKTWSDSVPRCLPINTKPKLSCDFETSDLCGWTHDLNHDFDWTRENYSTPSGAIGTGPSFDHTKGVGEGGHYMYTESSLKAENDTARLISPVYDKMDGEVCFEFYYHMYGATTGSLRVYLKTVDEQWNLNPKKAFFSKSGNHGDRWYKSLTHLGVVKDEFQIIIEGVRGPGYVSDIAIDDVKIIPDCTEEETTTVESSTFIEQVPIIDSCENRCGRAEAVSHDQYHLTCDCDDDCFTINRCCPDYFDICSATTAMDDFDTTIASGEVTTEKFVSTRNIVPVLKLNTTITASTIGRITTFKPKTTPIMKVPVTPLKPTTPKKYHMVSTPKPVTSKIISYITRPVLYFQTPPSTPEIYRKIITTTSPKPTPFIFIAKTTLTTSTKKTESTDDALDVPKPTRSDEGLYDIGVPKEFWPDEIDNNVDTPYSRNFSETNKLFSQSYVEEANSHFLIIGVSLTGVVIVISIVLFLAFRRYRFSKSIMSSNGESQSDVRYLTNNDVLDFSLGDCYNE